MTITVARASAPAPPYCSGTCGAWKSEASSASCASWGYRAFSSTSAANGATLASHTARTASRMAWCSSESAYSGKSELMGRILLPGNQHPGGRLRPRSGPAPYAGAMAEWQDPEATRFMLDDCVTWAVVGLSGDPDRTA